MMMVHDDRSSSNAASLCSYRSSINNSDPITNRPVNDQPPDSTFRLAEGGLLAVN